MLSCGCGWKILLSSWKLEIRACDVGVICCGGWVLSVGCVSTTDLDGSVTKADGVGLLMVGRNLKCSTTERFSLGFGLG